MTFSGLTFSAQCNGAAVLAGTEASGSAELLPRPPTPCVPATEGGQGYRVLSTSQFFHNFTFPVLSPGPANNKRA